MGTPRGQKENQEGYENVQLNDMKKQSTIVEIPSDEDEKQDISWLEDIKLYIPTDEDEQQDIPSDEDEQQCFLENTEGISVLDMVGPL